MPEVSLMVIGAMKAGTTTLVEYLGAHPAIFFARLKEPQYFSRPDKQALGLSWYESLFEGAQSGQILAEGSTCYSRWPTYDGVPERLYRYNPRLRFVYMTRHPVARAYSHYRHSWLRDEFKYRTFREALEKEPEILDAGKYMMQIEQFLAFFPRQQLYFAKFEDLVENNVAILNEILQFVGVEPFDFFKAGQALHSNRAGDAVFNRRLIDNLRSIRRLPLISRAVDFCVPASKRERVLQGVAAALANTPVAKRSLKRLADSVPQPQEGDSQFIMSRCADDLSAFRDFSGLSVDSWLEGSENSRQSTW